MFTFRIWRADAPDGCRCFFSRAAFEGARYTYGTIFGELLRSRGYGQNFGGKSEYFFIVFGRNFWFKNNEKLCTFFRSRVQYIAGKFRSQSTGILAPLHDLSAS